MALSKTVQNALKRVQTQVKQIQSNVKRIQTTAPKIITSASRAITTTVKSNYPVKKKIKKSLTLAEMRALKSKGYKSYKGFKKINPEMLKLMREKALAKIQKQKSNERKGMKYTYSKPKYKIPRGRLPAKALKPNIKKMPLSKARIPIRKKMTPLQKIRSAYTKVDKKVLGALPGGATAYPAKVISEYRKYQKQEKTGKRAEARMNLPKNYLTHGGGPKESLELALKSTRKYYRDKPKLKIPLNFTKRGPPLTKKEMRLMKRLAYQRYNERRHEKPGLKYTYSTRGSGAATR